MTVTYVTPARVWALAKLAVAHGWEVRIEPAYASLDVRFTRGPESVHIGWHTLPRVRLGHVTYGVTELLLRDIPSILTARATR